MEHFVELILPPIISFVELIGIFVVTLTAVHAFIRYIKNTFWHRHYHIQFYLANGLATGLEFKMAAEILKTVLVRDLNELLVLGAVIALRALLSVLIHFEMKSMTHEKEVKIAPEDLAD